MRVLLDECLPRRLKAGLRGHDCRTVPEVGLAGKKNGELLRLADGNFDVFVTIDAGIPYQQNLAGNRMAIIMLSARSNRLTDIEPLLPKILELLQTIGPGQIVRLAG